MIKKADSYKAVAGRVRSDDGISTISMFTLREVHGTERLGVNVVKQISEKLNEVGIAHEPWELPTDQSAIVLLFEKKSVLGRVLHLISNIDEETDEKIYKLIDADGAQGKLQEIKAIISDTPG